MKVTVIRDDNMVALDGVFLPMDLSALSEDIRAIQYNSAGTSWIEKADGKNIPLTNINDFKWIVDEYYVVRAARAAALAAAQAEEAAILAALRPRLDEINAAQEAANLRQYSVEQATAWITNTLTNAPNTVVGVKQAVGAILIKMLPYVLPK